MPIVIGCKPQDEFAIEFSVFTRKSNWQSSWLVNSVWGLPNGRVGNNFGVYNLFTLKSGVCQYYKGGKIKVLHATYHEPGAKICFTFSN